MNVAVRFGRITALALSLCVGACATSYQPYSFWGGGGFTETEVQPGLFLVRFIGNEQSTPDRTADFALLRAADLCLQRGKSHLLLGELATQYAHTGYLPGSTASTVVPTGSSDSVAVTVETSPPTPLYSPTSGIAVSCTETTGQGAWDAHYLERAIRTKYALT